MYSECIIINNVTCPSVITECLVQIIIHSEDKELSRDGDPSVIVIHTVIYIKIKKYDEFSNEKGSIWDVSKI